MINHSMRKMCWICTLLSIAILFSIGRVNAEPWLVSDPSLESEQVTGADIEMDGVIIQDVNIEHVGETSSVILMYDLANLPVNDHSVRARFKNIWGVSEWSTPFLFRNAPPSKPILTVQP